MTEHPTQIGQTPPSEAELKAWRQTARAAVVRDWIKTVGIYATLAFVIFNTTQFKDALHGIDGTTSAIRETQTEGSPFILRLTEISTDVQATLDQLQDCVQPRGECATENRRKSAQYLQVIGFYITCSARFVALPEQAAFAATNECVSRQTEGINP